MSEVRSQDPVECLLVAAATSDRGEALLTVAQVADALQVDVGWVYDHARALGSVRLGRGSKAPIRFEARTLAARLGDLDSAAPEPERRGTTCAPTRRPSRPAKRDGLLPVRARLSDQRIS